MKIKRLDWETGIGGEVAFASGGYWYEVHKSPRSQKWVAIRSTEQKELGLGAYSTRKDARAAVNKDWKSIAPSLE